jgi:hypothetical protein
MKLILQADRQTWRPGEEISVRLLAINDDYEPAAIDRRLLIGPNLAPVAGRRPRPINVEPAAETEAGNTVTLTPWAIYGRERTFSIDTPGKVEFHGYLLSRPEESLMPTGPSNPSGQWLAAEPLVLSVE